MGVQENTWRETEYREMNLMDVIRRIMMEGRTGQLTLHLSQGRVCSCVLREKVFNGNGHKKNFVDNGGTEDRNSDATDASLTVSRAAP